MDQPNSTTLLWRKRSGYYAEKRKTENNSEFCVASQRLVEKGTQEAVMDMWNMHEAGREVLILREWFLLWNVDAIFRSI